MKLILLNYYSYTVEVKIVLLLYSWANNKDFPIMEHYYNIDRNLIMSINILKKIMNYSKLQWPNRYNQMLNFYFSSDVVDESVSMSRITGSRF